MAFVSGGGGMGGVSGNVPPANQNVTTCTSSIRPQDGRPTSPRVVPQANSNLTQLQNSAAQLLYQQLLSGAAAQSQLLQGVAVQSPLLQAAAAAAATQQPQQPQNAFALASAAHALVAAQGQLTINQLLLQQQNPQQQQVQALAQLLNPLAYYQQLAALLQQPQLNAINHIPPANSQVQNGINTNLQQQKMVESLFAEQAARNSAHDRICQPGSSQAAIADNRNIGPLTSPESVKEHISRLISENEAILEQNPGVLKRRPYHRQVGAQSSIELETGVRSQSSSPGIREARTTSSRCQQTYEPPPHVPFAVRAVPGGSLTNGQPILRPPDNKCHICNYCQLKFPNEAGLDAHEIRCSRRAEMLHPSLQNSQSAQNCTTIAPIAQHASEAAGRKQNAAPSPTVLENRHPLKRRLLAAVEQRSDEPTATTSKAPKVEIIKQEATESGPSPIGISHPLAHNSVQFSEARTVNTAVSSAQVAVQSTVAERESGHKPHQPCVTALQSTAVAETEKPYILTLSDASAVRNEALPRRSRLRNITTETFACLNKPQPMFVEQKQKLSMYSNWQQTPVNAEEAKLNLLYMGTCSTKPRMGVKQLWRYTTALREMGALKVTHSSFWDFSTKLRLRQNAAASVCSQAAALMNANQPQAHSLPVDVSKPPAVILPKCEPAAQKLTTTKPQVTKEQSTVPEAKVATSEATEVEATKAQAKAVHKEQPKLPTVNTAIKQHIVGGYRTDEVYVYVRGRGRGRYVCDRCGIRCKKPSMLKKHMKSHTDIRPFKCTQCNFCFKTKGNLTKHLQSKAHRRRTAEQRKGFEETESDSDNGRLEIASPSPSDILSDDECSSDEDARHPPEIFLNDAMPYRKFGQENILIERAAHTPPSLWIVGESTLGWPKPDHTRICHSAPPAAHYSPESRKRRNVTNRPKHSEKMGEESGDDGEVLRRGRAMTLSVMPHMIPNATCAHEELSQASPSSAVCQSSMNAFLAKEEMPCDICGKVFRKATEYALHKHTHDLEQQQNARARAYQCTECKQNVRSRTLLNRHMETVHNCTDKRRLDQNDSDAEESTSSVSQTLNPRSFVCSDCNIGFRKHGVLAKHLRSKTHVTRLDTLGKLPEDALSLITRKENGACLNDIDTTDCDRARDSIIAIISALRDNTSLECREQMLQSPAPPPANCYSFGNQKRSPAPSNASSMNFGKRSPSATQQMFRKRGDSFSYKQNVDAVPRKRGDAVLSPQRKIEDTVAKSVSANIWIPPKPDLPLQCDRRSADIVISCRAAADSSALSDNGSSVRSDEANSEGAARSESSTPTQRPLNGAAPSPLLPVSTRCNLCDVNYETSFDLQVHLHADHVVLRDGKDFRCPNKYCDKVYPNRENLRLHIAAHYHGGGATPIPEGRDEMEGALTVLSDVNGDTAAVLHRKLTGSNSSQHANSAPNHSPGVPEESHTLACPKALSESPLSVTDANPDSHLPSSPYSNDASKGVPSSSSSSARITENTSSKNGSAHDLASQMRQNPSAQLASSSPAALPCAICGLSFSDAFTLQQHWLSHVCDRPHVCKLCDAGFTTQDALQAHTLTHQNVMR